MVSSEVVKSTQDVSVSNNVMLAYETSDLQITRKEGSSPAIMTD